MSRFEGETRLREPRPGDKGKGRGQGHVDMYTVIKFISIVGASESILKLNSKTPQERLRGDQPRRDKKVMVDKPNIWKMWDGGKEDLEAPWRPTTSTTTLETPLSAPTLPSTAFTQCPQDIPSTFNVTFSILIDSFYFFINFCIVISTSSRTSMSPS